jgi:hypothetical protein
MVNATRTYRFAILGMSLSNLLDIQQPQDLIRGIMNIMAEYEQSKEEGDKLKKVLPLPLCFVLGDSPIWFLAAVQ